MDRRPHPALSPLLARWCLMGRGTDSGFDTARVAAVSAREQAARDRELTRLGTELGAALHRLRVAKRTFAVITDIYRRRSPDPVTAEFRASGNYDRQRAVVDASWWRSEADTASLALMALGGGGR